MEISRKMTLATVNNLRKGLKDVKTTAFVARFFGVALAVAAEPTASGGVQWKFTGEFQGVSADGKQHAAPVLYLPAPADAALSAAIKLAGTKPVKFGYDLYAEPSADSAIGYALTAKPLIEPAALDSLADLASSLPAAPLAPKPLPETPAPTPDPAPAPTPSAPAPEARTKPRKK